MCLLGNAREKEIFSLSFSPSSSWLILCLYSYCSLLFAIHFSLSFFFSFSSYSVKWFTVACFKWQGRIEEGEKSDLLVASLFSPLKVECTRETKFGGEREWPLFSLFMKICYSNDRKVIQVTSIANFAVLCMLMLPAAAVAAAEQVFSLAIEGRKELMVKMNSL